MVNRVLPTDEQIDATLLHFRFFLTRCELISYQSLPNVYRVLALPQEIQKECDSALSGWATWRESKSNLFTDKTNAETINVLFFGERAHRNNPDVCFAYDEYIKQSESKTMCRAELLCLLGDFFTQLLSVRIAHHSVLTFLSKCQEISPEHHRARFRAFSVILRRSKTFRSHLEKMEHQLR